MKYLEIDEQRAPILQKVFRLYATGAGGEALSVLYNLCNTGLRKGQGILFLPSMRGMAMQPYRKFQICHRQESDEKGNSCLAG